MGLGERHPRADVLGRSQLRAHSRLRINPPQLALPGGAVRCAA
jgi:hypothetical protein